MLLLIRPFLNLSLFKFKNFDIYIMHKQNAKFMGRDPQIKIGCSFWNSLAENDLLDMLQGWHPEKINIL